MTRCATEVFPCLLCAQSPRGPSARGIGHQRRGNIQNNITYKLVEISDNRRFLGKPPDVSGEARKSLEKLIETLANRVDLFLGPDGERKSETVAYMRVTYDPSKRSLKAVQFSFALL